MDEARELLRSGRLTELELLIERLPQVEALHIDAVLKLGQQRPQEALAAIRRSLDLESSFSQRNTLAVCLLNCGHHHEAAQVLQDLLAEQPDNPDLWFNLARARASGPEALEAASQANRLRPGWRQAELLQASLAAHMGQLDEALALVRRDVTQPSSRQLEIQLVLSQGRYRAASQLCLAYLHDEGDSEPVRELLIQALLGAGQLPQDPRILEHLERSLGLPGAYQLVPPALRLWPQRQSLLLALLQHDLVCDLALERTLTEWRRHFRFHPQPCELAEALAAHNFTNEFCFAESPDEVDGLQPDHPAYPLYRPLLPGQSAPALVSQRHLEEPARERELQAQFTPLAPLDAVADQYQQNPYPRWRSLERSGPPRPFHEVLGGLFPHQSIPVLDAVKILVAGCGTGRHALYCAQRYCQAQVWAVDLSPTSLAYAARQSERLGVSGVHFFVADLLELEKVPLPSHFDLIESIGVLHHLACPATGLKALRQRLPEHGWMRLGWYSRRARLGLQPARRLARELQPMGLRELRTQLMQQLAPADLQFLAGIKDFYSLSGLRDLLLHEREAEYDLSQIAQLLCESNLEFVGFDALPQSTLHKFRESCGAHNLGNLDCWDFFEQRHPRTFLGMYVFWCRPSAHAGGHLAGSSGELLGA